MCGRINVSDNEGLRLLLEYMGMDTWPGREPRFNVAPTQTLDVVTLESDLTLSPMSWGVSMTLPGKKGMVTKRLQNARDDKVWSSRLWAPLMKSRRALVPVNGFYEWQRKNKKIQAAYHIGPSQSTAMFMAGMYRAAPAGEGAGYPEVTVITTAANDAMRPIHDRIPVILATQNEAMAWLQETDQSSLTELMTPVSNEWLTFTEVSSYVNKSSNEGPECLKRVGPS